MSSPRLWGQGKSTDQQILEFTVGHDYLLDQRLVAHDIRASRAHVRMLAAKGLLTSEEAQGLLDGLAQVGLDHEAGGWQISLDQEDCHTAIEAQLTARLGDLGGKVHLGRSRNDQVLTAIRLYLRAEIEQFTAQLEQVAVAFDKLTATSGEISIPGYTHLQQAMPSSVALWAGGFASNLRSNLALLRAADDLASLCPLGSAAGYGTPGLSLDRDRTSEELGFAAPQQPVTACQTSRGKAESALAFALTQILHDLGRMAADVCLFASQEFGIIRLDDSISTGSSIMPQKRNPDVFELIRAHGSQATADLIAILTLTEKLTSGYHRDYQLMKEPLFRVIDRAHLVLDVAAYALGKITFDAARAKAITDPSIHAATRAFELVQNEGLSFRAAYHRVAQELST